MALLPTPAHAGHWVLTTTGSGESDVNGVSFIHNFTAPPPATNSVTVSGFGSGVGIGPVIFFWETPATIIATANLSITVTGVWTSDTNSDNTPPPSIVFGVSSFANATYNNNGGPMLPGTANDGYGDPVFQFGNSIGTSQTPGIKYLPGSKTFTVKLTLSASGTGTNGFAGGAGAGASVGPVTIGVHAQPYGWYDAGHLENGVFVAGPYANNTAGTLTYTYGWSSTSGNKSDLSGIMIYEVLDYSGNPGTMSADKTTFYPQSPPVISGYNVFNGKAGTPFDAGDPIHPYAEDDNSVFPTVSPLRHLTPLTWTIPQKYEFDDPATGEVGTVLKDEGNIVEVLKANPNQFTITKSGSTAKKPL